MKFMSLTVLLFTLASCATPVTTPPFGVAAENVDFVDFLEVENTNE